MQGVIDHRPTVHVVQRLAPGGIETIVADLVRDDPAGTYVLSLEGTTDELRTMWPALADIEGRFEGLARKEGIRPGLALELAKRLRQIAPKAVFLHHIGPLIYGRIAARLANIPAAIHVEHDVWHYDAPRRRVLISAMERALPTAHIAVSQQAADVMRQMLPRANIAVIPNGVDLDRFKPRSQALARSRFGLDLDRTIVGTAGRLVPVKGHDTLVAAAAHLPEGMKIVIVGDGPERAHLEAKARALRIADRIQFLGHVDGIEMLLPAFDAFCLPSRNEGMPRSLLEAQACGLPVIATDVGAVREVICAETGLVVPANDAAALADAIRKVATRPAGASPRDFTARNFSWKDTVQSYKRAAEMCHAA